MGGMLDPRVKAEYRQIPDGSGVQEVRVFTDPAVQQAVDDALKSVPTDKRGVILEVDMPQMGEVKGVLAAKLNQHWSIGLVGDYSGARGVSGGVRVAFQW